MEKVCLNHRDKAAVAQCHQCHKPVCNMCVMDDPLGKFCSPQCMARYKDFKNRWKEPNTKPPFSIMGALSGLVMLAVIALGIAWIGNNVLGIGFFAPYDYLGKFLKKKDAGKEAPPETPANQPK